MAHAPMPTYRTMEARVWHATALRSTDAHIMRLCVMRIAHVERRAAYRAAYRARCAA